MKQDKPFLNDNSMSRIAVLEQIAKETHETLIEIKQGMKEAKSESWSQFRWLLGIMITLFSLNTSGILVILSKVWH